MIEESEASVENSEEGGMGDAEADAEDTAGDSTEDVAGDSAGTDEGWADAEPEETVESADTEADAESEETVEADDTDESENEETAEETAEANPKAIKPEISFPLEQHTCDSIINLVFSIYSKGSLISKSTGGIFTASQDLVDKLRSTESGGKEDVIKAIQEDGGLAGISFDESRVTFDGFAPTADPDEVRAWTVLAAAINKNAIEQGHIRAKTADESNEKYAFRTWLTRIGLKGADTKMERKILYRNLSGHTTFRTENDREKWNAMMRAKKERENLAADRAETGTPTIPDAGAPAETDTAEIIDSAE